MASAPFGFGPPAPALYTDPMTGVPLGVAPPVGGPSGPGFLDALRRAYQAAPSLSSVANGVVAGASRDGTAAAQSLVDNIDWFGRVARNEAPLFDPETGHVSEDAVRRSFDLAGLAMTGGAGGVARQGGESVLGAGPIRRPPGATPDLPMDEASRMARAAEQGYDPQPFYRGEATGKVSDEHVGGAFFSRDPEVARGFANRGGQAEPREFRLNLSNAFRDYEPVNAGAYGRLVESALKHDPDLARNLTELITEMSPERLVAYGRKNPDEMAAESGVVLRPVIERSRAPEDVWRDAGFNALDVGRDVRMLDGFGIRSKDAAFDPALKEERNIMFGLAAPMTGAGLLGPDLLEALRGDRNSSGR